VRDVGRVMDRQNEADRVARLIPAGPKVTIDGSLENVKELKQLYTSSPQIKQLVDMARDLEGTVRSTGIHAAGVVISREPLDQVLPVQLRDYKDPNSWLVSQYEQAHLEELGLLKMDFLGLSNLTILQTCQRFIQQTRGIDLDLDRLPVDDPKTFALLGEGETTGIFQLESGAMRGHVKELKPNCLEDLTAMVALYRPGPMDSIPQFIKAKHGQIAIKYLHPALEPLLRESYGVIVYQDQVLLIAIQLAGFSWGEVDKFRKAMSKKLPKEMAAYREKFVKGCKANGIDGKTADALFSFIEPFAGYGFNKAHACAYAWVAYQTAYLKANYTPEFMAATLTTEAGDAKKVVAAVEECRRMGVEVLRPDINRSQAGFTVEALASGEDGETRWGVRFGLLAIKNVGTRPVEELLEARRTGDPFTSLAEVFARSDSKNLTRGAVECLIKAGACDDLGRRSQLLHSLDRAMALGQQQRKMREIGQTSLFGAGPAGSGIDFQLAAGPEYPRQQLLAWEKELLNLYLSAHPLSHVAAMLSKRSNASVGALTEEWAGQRVTLGGRVTDVRRSMTKQGAAMAWVQLEDMQGAIEVVIFPRTYAATAERWHEDAILIVTGTVKMRDEEPQIVCDEVEEFVPTEEELNRQAHLLRIRLARRASDPIDIATIGRLQDMLRRFPGDDPFEVLVRNGRWEARFSLPRSGAGIKLGPELMQRLEELLGSQTIEVVPVPTRE
ncbi:MAG TPA: DNA polymerase III subunit alpha, partial [Ktedonobacterales bacterium]|nr:DNA polymerase III subunit alpha [Ktedonobacterales bacterium]